ncbi:MAG: Crp/Fnr family transcriptional regulator, partial [Pseudohongiella sp.]|nr:Crp/Fnr family transcriptional regulator [Pseudohongiella sp.]
MFTGSRLLQGNRLVDELPVEQHNRLLAKSELISLNTNQILCDQEMNLTHVYFPTTATISMM